MKYDDLLHNYIGDFGRYQKMQYALVVIPAAFVAMHVVSWTFTGAVLDHRCLYPNEDRSVDEFSKVYEAFNVSTEEDKKALQCERPVGLDIFNMSQGSLSSLKKEKYGRKKAFLLAILLQCSSGLLMAFVPWIELFAVLRMIVGFGHPGVFMISVVIGVELVGPSKRWIGGIATGILFGIGQACLGLLAYFIRDYKMLQLAISVPYFFFLTYWWLVPESARWLISQKRIIEADSVLRKAATSNKRELPENWYDELDVDNKTQDGDRRYGCTDLFRTPNIRKRTFIAFFCWPTVSMVYYGLAMNPSFLGGNRYITFIASALAEIPGILAGAVFVNRLGRKFLLIFGYLMGGLLLLITLAVPKDAVVALSGLVIVSKALMTMTYAVIYTYTPELFPTVIRNTAMGMCSMMARIGGVAASYMIMYLVSYSKEAVVVTFSVCSLIASFLCLLLPETYGTTLPETLEDAEKFGKGVSIFSFKAPASKELPVHDEQGIPLKDMTDDEKSAIA